MRNLSLNNLVLWDSSRYWLGAMIALITMLAVVSNFDSRARSGERMVSIFMVVNIFVMFGLLKSSSIISFYIMFEIGALPIFFIIIGWGNQPEKLKASFFIFFFTIVSSAPLLVGILFVQEGRLRVTITMNNCGDVGSYTLSLEAIAFISVIRIIAKMPMFGVHNWLPKAHVEAPVYGSMILAGILLKLGGLGAIRLWALISSNIIPSAVAVISLVGMAIVRLVVATKTDMKQIVAFRSVIHMAIPIILISLQTETRLLILLLCLVSHAFRSSAIFFLVYFFYMRTGRRNIILLKGTSHLYTPMKVLWAGVVVARLGGPPFFNLLTEMLSLQLLFILFGVLAVALVVPGVLTCVYHIILYAGVTQGKLTEVGHAPRPADSPSFYGVTVVHLVAALISSLVVISIAQSPDRISSASGNGTPASGSLEDIWSATRPHFLGKD